MKLQPKNAAVDEPAAEVVTMPWDAALTALASGAYDMAGNPKPDETVEAPASDAAVVPAATAKPVKPKD